MLARHALHRLRPAARRARLHGQGGHARGEGDRARSCARRAGRRLAARAVAAAEAPCIGHCYGAVPGRGGWMKRTIAIVVASFVLAPAASAAVPLTRVAQDTFTNTDSQHRTIVEPDTF